ncbi:MAG: radical SAM protein [Treponema sp.]|nr:radical SAM protein [Treponema sp.]
MNCIRDLASKYYQLYFTPQKGMSTSEEYERVVLCGGKPDCFSNLLEDEIAADSLPIPSGFCTSENDSLFFIQTPVGLVECVYLENRADFERLIQILVYRCEDTAVPASMGACTVRNLVNWRKIEAHKAEYLAASGNPFAWQEEFKEFTKKKENYRENLIIISKGAYSAVPAEEIGMETDLWIEISRRLRLYHECTHIICRDLCPKYVSPLWDEVLADCIGLCAATGSYNPTVAERLLGIDSYGWYNGGRLENYFSPDIDMQLYVPVVKKHTGYLAKAVEGKVFSGMSDTELFKLLINIEKSFWAEAEACIPGVKLKSTAASCVSSSVLPAIDDYLTYLRRHPVPELFGDECMKGLEHLSREYGTVPTDYAFEEVRLNETECTMDFSFREKVSSIKNIKEFWFEIDSEQYTGTKAIQPCWFIDAEKVRPGKSFPWLYEDILPQFLSDKSIEKLRPNLERCVQALEGLSPSLYQIGVMAGRGTSSDEHAAIRIFTQKMTKQDIITFLKRCAWCGDTDVIMDWMTQLEPYSWGRVFNVDFDILPDGYSEKLGINFYAKKTIADAKELLEFLEKKGLCLPEKRDGVLKLLSMPSCFSPWIEPYWSHVKLPYQNGKVSSAKAYLTQGYVQLKEDALEYPADFNLELTDRCPLHCPQCYCSLENAHDMPLETAMHWLHEAASHGVRNVELSGGETLCYPHLYEVIAEAYRLGLCPNVALSGAGFSEEVFEKLVNSGVYGIFISLNAPDEKTNALSRDGYKLAVYALEILHKKNFKRIHINWVMHSTNADTFSDMIKLAEKYGVKQLVVMQFKPDSKHELLTLPSKIQMQKVADQINSYKGPVKIVVESCFSPMRALVSQAFLINTNQGLRKGCSAGLSTFSVSIDGKLTPCRHIPYAESYETLEDYWHNSPVLKDLRRVAEKCEEPCSDCMYFKYCRPCRAIGLKLDGKLHSGNQHCTIAK